MYSNDNLSKKNFYEETNDFIDAILYIDVILITGAIFVFFIVWRLIFFHTIYFARKKSALFPPSGDSQQTGET